MVKDGHVLYPLPELRSEGGGDMGAAGAGMEDTHTRTLPEAERKGNSSGVAGKAQTGDERLTEGVKEDR